jgi:FlaA1/EpsC-like NDP-sugar epimerase
MPANRLRTRRSRLLPVAAFAFDLCALTLAWFGSYLLRFESSIPQDFLNTAIAIWPAALLMHGACFWRCGLYRGLWLFASLPDLLRIIKAVLLGGVLTIIAVLVFHPLPTVPRTILFLSPLLELLIMGGARFTYRATKEFYRYGGLLAQGRPVLIVGAGQAAATLIRELARSSEWRLMGLLDDDATKHGRDLQGWTILGPIAELPRWAEHYHVEHVIIAMPSASLAVQKRVFSLCIDHNLKVMVLPSLTPMDQGLPFLSRVRKLDLEDLLGRDPVEIDTPQVAELLSNKVVLVTGAGGSIGSELCRQIARFAPRQLIVVDQSEFALYRITEEFALVQPALPLVGLAGDVKDDVFLEHLFTQYQPSEVFHAAAYKHVPLMEQVNAWQAVRNNVLGTLKIAEVAARHRVKHFVLISTDKAVNPTNVMGATKRLAEMVCQALQSEFADTLFEIVRFGNVLGSDGSVVPKFQEQIARGGPVTVTHAEITRYFMTIPEAAQLVLQASCMGEGGEIFLLDMGEPIKIAQLARDLIHLHGFTEQQIAIEYTGLRPGEKMFEELLADDETTRRTHHPKLRIARARDVLPDLIRQLRPWLDSPRMRSESETRAELQDLIPEYQVQKPVDR